MLWRPLSDVNMAEAGVMTSRFASKWEIYHQSVGMYNQ